MRAVMSAIKDSIMAAGLAVVTHDENGDLLSASQVCSRELVAAWLGCLYKLYVDVVCASRESLLLLPVAFMFVATELTSRETEKMLPLVTKKACVGQRFRRS